MNISSTPFVATKKMSTESVKPQRDKVADSMKKESSFSKELSFYDEKSQASKESVSKYENNNGSSSNKQNDSKNEIVDNDQKLNKKSSKASESEKKTGKEQKLSAKNENSSFQPEDNKVFSNRHLIQQLSSKEISPDAYGAVKTLSDRIDQLGVQEQDIVDPLMRRSAIQTFMYKMQKDYNVSPLDLVNAFSKLSVEDLGKSPELTVEKVVDNLQISPQLKNDAILDFSKMLEQTSSDSMADYLKASGRQLSLEVMSKQQLKNQKLQDSLSQMNTQFFGSQKIDSTSLEGMPKSLEAELKALSLKKGQLSGDLDKPLDTQKSGAVPLGMMAAMGKGLENKGGSPSVFSQNSLNGLSNVVAESSSPLNNMPNHMTGGMGKLNELSIHDKANSQANGNAHSGVMNMNGQTIEDLVSRLSVLAGSVDKLVEKSAADIQTADFSSKVDAGLALAPLSTSSADSDESLTDDQENLDFSQLIKSPSKELKIESAATFTMGNVNASDVDQAENIKEITQQSQLLATKGGGEAKIKLNPDGLGEITMKVKVADGRVHVDLLAENNHTKKLIEKGLGDLKANLAAHKLDVDMIKVDLSNNVADQFKDQQRDAERHFAQQFLQDFRQNNQGFKQNFSYPGDSLSKSQLEDRAINYNDGNPVPTKAKKSSRRLDLVA